MTEQDKEEATLFGTIPTRIPVSDVIRAKRIGFGRMEQQRIDLVPREERLAWIIRVEQAITFLQSYRAGASMSLDIELGEMSAENEMRTRQNDMKYRSTRNPDAEAQEEKRQKQIAAAMELLGLTSEDLKK